MNNTQNEIDFSEMDDNLVEVKKPKTDAELDAEMLELMGDYDEEE